MSVHEAVPSTTQLNSQELYSPIRPEDIRLTPDGAEFQIGDIRYAYQGPTETGMQFASMGPDGVQRPLTVYRSSSQGSYRVSQGYETFQDGDETKTRLMKGRELSSDSQYTQDTQLHPAFDEAVGRIEEIRALRGMPVRRTPHYDEKGAEWLMRDFEAQTTVHALPNKAVDQELRELRADNMSKADVEKLTGFNADTSPTGARAAYMRKIRVLNKTLEASGIMPDFDDEPVDAVLTEHAQLGNVVKETFAKTVNGKTYEWQMAHDENGRVWIERIRFADAEMSVYGTDKDMVYSGILTAKPLDYTNQCDGVPADMRTDIGNGYSDITPFLQELAPVKQYAANYHRRDQYYHFLNVA